MGTDRVEAPGKMNPEAARYRVLLLTTVWLIQWLVPGTRLRLRLCTSLSGGTRLRLSLHFAALRFYLLLSTVQVLVNGID